MKKTLIALMALAGVTLASEYKVILDQDFCTETPVSITHGSTGTYDGVTWTAGDNNKGNKNPTMTFGTNGLYSSSDNWSNAWLKTNLTESLTSTTGNTYLVSYELAGTPTGQMLLMLSGTSQNETYTLAVGHSYTSSPKVALGFTNAATGVDGADGFITFATDAASVGTGTTLTKITSATGKTDTGILAHSDSGAAPYSVSMLLSSGSVTLTVTQGETVFKDTYAIAQDFSFDSLTFSFDSPTNDGSVGIKNVYVELVPEPATATLSLLALAGLAVRRRRR